MCRAPAGPGSWPARDPVVRSNILDGVEPVFAAAANPAAGLTVVWHTYTDAQPAALSARDFLTVLSNSDFTLSPLGYSLATHRQVEALLRGSILVLNRQKFHLSQYFVRRGAVRRGNVTQGYCGADARLLEDYSGPASCLWSLRSLVVACARPDTDAFWQGKREPLPVELGDYSIPIPATGWTVAGRQSSGTITIETGCATEPPLKGFSRADCLYGVFLRLPHRPKKTEAKYLRARYASTSPYGLDIEHLA